MLFNVIYGLAGGLCLAFLGYFKSSLASKVVKGDSNLRGGTSIAVLMATRNEEQVIENTIKTLLRDAPPSVRVIVVDESSDATFSVLENLARQFPNLLVLRHEGRPGKPTALNIGLEHAREDIVLFLDADARFHWSSIRQYLKAFNNSKVNAVFANFSSYNAKRSLAVVLHDVYFSFAKAFVFSGLFSKPIFMNSGFFIRRKVFDTVGRFDPETIVDDFDLYLRMGKKGFKARFVHGPNCEIQYAFRIKEMFRQHCRWDTGWLRKLFELVGEGDYKAALTLGAISALVFFPYIAVVLGYCLHLPVFLYAVIPIYMSMAYAATLFAYLFYDVRNWKDALFNACLGMFVVYLLLQLTILVSAIRAVRNRHIWYKVTREQS